MFVYQWSVVILQSIQSYAELLPRLLAASFVHRPQIIMIDGIDQVNIRPGVHEFSYNLIATCKLYVPEWWHEVSSILRIRRY